MNQSFKQIIKPSIISSKLTLAAALSVAVSSPVACLGDTAAAPETAAAKTSVGKTVPMSITESDPQGDLTLSDLRDCGLALNQIRQQAINVFLEATRKSLTKSSKLELDIPASISDKDIEAHARKNCYQAPRVQWLVYYVGTVEPVIALLAQDVRDTKNGVTKQLVPEEARAKLLPLWNEWSAGIDGINKELTEINNLIGDEKADNVALAKHAVAMFRHCEYLERARQRASSILCNSEKRNAEGNKVNLP